MFCIHFLYFCLPFLSIRLKDSNIFQALHAKKCYLKYTLESFIFKLFHCKIIFHLGKMKGFTCINSECIPNILVKIRFGNLVFIMKLLNRSVCFYGTLFPVVVFYRKRLPPSGSVENASHVL